MSNDNVAHALAGAGGGALSTVVTYPLITLSTRAQTESKRSKSEQSTQDTKTSVSPLEAAKQIIQREGIAGLYSGLDSALFGISVTNFVYYYFYEATRTFYEKSKRASGQSLNLSTAESMIAGAVAGSATVALTNPIWVVNTRMTVKDSARKDPVTGVILSPPMTLGTIRDIIEKDGAKAFFSGILPALVLVINPILQYTIFEQLKNMIERKRKLQPLDAFFLGAFGKIIATSLTYPYITLKARMQLRKKDANAKSVGIFEGFRNILANEGVAGLYGGIFTKVTQSAITSAFLFLFKEQLYALALVVLGVLRNLRKRN